ncbi:anhydro-N-acetylmuramic acid kinase [Mesorhizobium sp.]|uniref:anhydro-N-acetylmuramic acid kinase n=1 Tax=Mesorhizobium sp. TaxID=1871066 RepID=UPI000FE69985|nr:MAG: hypothetical protein EOS62_01955 [Mesorhizobium sp.]RWF03417.1 MAG: hypothetical protein EOS43_04945 [Mesorhizobium sp.]TIX07239.1 MAG: hypothetical protein E5V57_02290 [Mesorhizobium sp.]
MRARSADCRAVPRRRVPDLRLLCSQSSPKRLASIPSGGDGGRNRGARVPRSAGASHRTSESWVTAQLREGLLTSYWWKGPAYGMWIQARSGIAPSEASLAAAGLLNNPQDQPSLAMLALALSERERGLSQLVRSALIATQDRDGSWRCGPCLRVTNRRCDEAPRPRISGWAASVGSPAQPCGRPSPCARSFPSIHGESQRRSLRSPTDIHKFAHATCGVVLQSLGRPYDKDGEVASKGKVDDMLMVRLKEHDLFKRPIPRSAWRLDFGSSCHERNRICGLRSRANLALMEDRRKDRHTARRPQLSGGEPPGERHG